MKKTKVIVVGNRKGGVGKSRISSIMAGALSSPPFDRKVLFLDADPQQSIIGQRILDMPKHVGMSPSYHILRIEDGMTGILRITEEAKEQGYDYVFIDVPGTLDDFTRQVLFVTDLLLVPFVPDEMALNPTIEYLKFALEAKAIKLDKGWNDLQIVGFVNMYKKRDIDSKQATANLAAFKEAIQIMETPLGRYAAIKRTSTLHSLYNDDEPKNQTAVESFKKWLEELMKTKIL